MMNRTQHSRRFFAWLLTLVMLMTSFAMPAYAQADWELLSLRLSWTDADGNQREAYAAPVTWSEDQSYWVQVTADAPLAALTMNISHPNHAYAFDPADGSTLMNVVDASSLDGMSMLTIQAYENDVWATSFNLYVSTQIAMPEEPTPEPAVVNVLVRHTDTNGNALVSDYYATCTEGQENAVYAQSIDGYTLQGDSVVYVQVNSDGTTNPTEVVFQFEENQPEPAVVNVLVRHTDTNGNALVSDYYATCTEGQENAVYAQSIDGYTLQGDSVVYVQVNSDGTTNPAEVVFQFAENQPEPAVVNVLVRHTDANGNALVSDYYATCTEGQENAVYAQTIDGYTLQGDSVVYVQVNSDGTTNPTEVVFRFEENQPEPAVVNVLVRHTDTNGNSLVSDYYATCTEGQENAVYAQTIDGYTLQGESVVYVQVNSDGTTNPAEVVFQFTENQPEPAVVNVLVRHTDTNGNSLVSDYYATCTEGQENAVYAQTIDGYTLQGDSVVYVQVNSDGSTNPTEVVFQFAMNEQATEAPTDEPTQEPTQVPTDEPTQEPTQEPTDEPTQEPTQAPTDEPTQEPTAEPTDEPTPSPVVETPIPQGTMINRFGTITMKQTALRTSPEKKDSNVNRRLAKGTVVYLLREELNSKGESWTRVLVDGEIYYVSTSCLEVMSQADSDSWMNNEMATPVPPYTADQLDHPEEPTEAPTQVPTDVPTEVPTQEPTDVPTEAPTQEPTDVPTEAPTPVPEIYTGYALTTSNVAIRSQVNGGDETITYLTQMKELVMVTAQEFADGSTWSYVTTLDNSSGYVPDANLRHINSEEAQYYIDQWTEAHATATPTTEPTATPTTEPTSEPTQVPDQYVGYALTTGAVAIRTEISTADSSIITRLDAGELVMVSGQSYANGESWSLSTTLDNVSGYIPDSSLRRINQEEAAYYINKWEEEHPTPTPTAAPATPEPAKISGYAYTVGDDVYFRNQATTMASIIDVLAKDTVVYVNDQDYTSGQAWHVVQYNSQWGYIRADMLRMMTVQEENAYLDSLNTPEPTPEDTIQPYNPESLSSYGYVSGSSVNFRKEANTSSSRIRELKQYALCLVLGTTEVNGVTWYRVNYGGQEGYVHGKYFKHMTMDELETFLESDDYVKGITNNSTSSTNQDYTTGGGVVSAEDQTVDKWTNPNNGLNVSYEPFDPFATVAPIETVEPTATVTISVEPTATLEPIPTMDVVYPTDSQEQGGSGILGWIIAVVVIALIGGGVYVYVTYTNNKRKAAQRAAARRAQAAQQQRNGEGRPYARSAQPNQPRTGTYPNQAAQQARRPAAPQQTYARPVETEKPADYTASYRNPETAETTRPVGRRSAYRAQQTQQNGYTASYRPEENGDFKQDKDNGDFE